MVILPFILIIMSQVLSDNSTRTFNDNEVLLTNDNITFSTTFIALEKVFPRV